MKTVFITGGNRGLGLEFVKQYSQLGYGVIATCRNPDEARELNDLKATSTTDIKIHSLDVTQLLILTQNMRTLALLWLLELILIKTVTSLSTKGIGVSRLLAQRILMVKLWDALVSLTISYLCTIVIIALLRQLRTWL